MLPSAGGKYYSCFLKITARVFIRQLAGIEIGQLIKKMTKLRCKLKLQVMILFLFFVRDAR